MEVGTAPMEKSMEIPQKTELPYDPEIPLLGIYPYKTKKMHPFVHTSTIHNSQGMEAT